MEKEGIKNDFRDGKLRWDLLPLDVIEKIVEIYTFGAKKYKENSWQNLPDGYQRYKAALFRHITAYEKGEVYDSESGCMHLAHAAWNAIAMLYFGMKEEKNSDIEKALEYLKESAMTEKSKNSNVNKAVPEGFLPSEPDLLNY